ncbi:MAG: DUF819 domain-containing protein [Planctomycetota bacterium JB042]
MQDEAAVNAPAAAPADVAPLDAVVAETALIGEAVPVLAVLLGVLAALFAFNKTAAGRKLYGIVPILVFCYFVPTALSNTGLIPSAGGFALYVFVKDWLLPASLLLLVLSVDIPAILRLGRSVLLLFLTALVSIMLAGPLAYLALGWQFSPEDSEQAWRGLAALSGSWIGGGANMTAVKESVGASDTILGAIVVVDVFVAEVWTAILFWFAGREKKMDAAIDADRTRLDEVRAKAEAYHAQVRRPTDLASLLSIAAIAFIGTVLAREAGAFLASALPENDILGAFAWTVILITFVGLILSFTPVRRLEGAGASHVGSVLLYLLVATIGAKAHFAKVFEPENLPLLGIGALWMVLHVAAMLIVRRRLKAPIFFAAIGSRACIGGAASAPIVAAAFNPALVPVGVLLAILGYVFGTLGGVATAFLLQTVNGILHGG